MKKDVHERALQLDLYRRLYLIRRAEEEIIAHYAEDEMKTPMHMSMGSEAIAVGLCCALREDDQVFGSYRSHALYLAKTLDVEDFFAELYGRDTAFLRGKGGSMHLCAPRQGFMGVSAIVASMIPVAIGAAFANKRLGNGKVVAVFFGDGAIDEGVFWESLNAACLYQLPVVFVCEDNDLAVHVPAARRHGYDSIAEIVARFRCRVVTSDSTDVEVIHPLAAEAIRPVRAGRGPCFMHLKYYRYLEHVGVHEDFEAGYRSRETFESWRQVDPVTMYRDRLMRSADLEARLRPLESEIDDRVIQGRRKARAASYPGDKALFEGVFR